MLVVELIVADPMRARVAGGVGDGARRDRVERARASAVHARVAGGGRVDRRAVLYVKCARYRLRAISRH
eukprot:5380273-Prymnesium_polylepis.1